MDVSETTPAWRGVVCLDFDDTLCDAVDQPLPDARSAVETLRSWGYRVIISSARFSPIYGELNQFRIQKVQKWLDAQEITVDAVSYAVPAAEIYVDDLAHRFHGSWSRLQDEFGLPERPRLSGHRVSIGLECLLGLDGVVPGALEGLRMMREAFGEIVVSAGPHLPGHDRDGDDVVGDDADAGLVRIRHELQAAGLWPVRVEVAKISSIAYVGSRACVFNGSWAETLCELGKRLELRAGEASDGPLLTGPPTEPWLPA